MKKQKYILFILIALIIGFFLIPILALCYNDSKDFPGPVKFASILLFFFYLVAFIDPLQGSGNFDQPGLRDAGGNQGIFLCLDTFTR